MEEGKGEGKLLPGAGEDNSKPIFVKLTYLDGDEIRAIKGWIIHEDNIFITIRRSSDGREFSINKTCIQKIERNGNDFVTEPAEAKP